MRVANLRMEVGLPTTASAAGALRSPLPGRLRKMVPKDALLPARPSPLSLHALGPKASQHQHEQHTAFFGRDQPPVQRRPKKLTLPSLDVSPAPSATTTTTTTSHNSTLDEQFEIVAKLEVAIYGTVVKALRRSDGKAVAIKILNKERIRRRLSMKDTPVFENAQVELTVLQKSADCPHPNVLRSIAAAGTQADVLHDSKSIYCITPFCDGGELYHTIRAADGLPAVTATKLFDGIVRGVCHLHTELGYVHNDISPENILLRSMHRLGAQGGAEQLETVPVLTDFGLATPLGEPASRVPGKVCYQAPEVLYASGERTELRVADAASDVFSLGVLFFVMLTGVLPYGRPHKSDAKYAALQEGAAAFGAAAAQWDIEACTTLVEEHYEMLRLICAMTRHDARERLSLVEVLERLQGPAPRSPDERRLGTATGARREAGDPATSPSKATPFSSPLANALAAPRSPDHLDLAAGSEPLRGRMRRRQRRSTGQDLAMHAAAATLAAQRDVLSQSTGAPTPVDGDDDDGHGNLPFTLDSGTRSADDAATDDEEDEYRTPTAGDDDDDDDDEWLDACARPRRMSTSRRRRCAFQPARATPLVPAGGGSSSSSSSSSSNNNNSGKNNAGPGGLDGKSPCGVADLAFLRQRTGRPRRMIAQQPRQVEATANDGGIFQIAAARARLGSNSGSAEHIMREQQLPPRRRRDRREPAVRKTPPKRRNKKLMAVARQGQPMSGLLHKVLQKGLHLDGVRVSRNFID